MATSSSSDLTTNPDSESNIQDAIVSEEYAKEFKEEFESKHKKIKILCGGPTGAGKSTLLNALMGIDSEEVSDDDSSGLSFHVGDSLVPGTLEVLEQSFEKDGVQVTIWDTPGLEGNENNDAGYLQKIKEKCADFDLFFYCIRSNDTRATELLDEKSSLKKFTELFGVKIWKNAVVVLTFANALLSDFEEKKEVNDNADRSIDPKKLFKEKIEEWQSEVRGALREMKVPNKIIKKVPILPAGSANRPDLPGHPLWLKKLFTQILNRMKYKAKMAWIQVNGLAGLAGTGFAVVGTATGATVGALVGALAIGAVTFGTFAGVGLVLGGILGGVVGSHSGVVIGLALKYFMEYKLKKKRRQNR